MIGETVEWVSSPSAVSINPQDWHAVDCVVRERLLRTINGHTYRHLLVEFNGTIQEVPEECVRKKDWMEEFKDGDVVEWRRGEYWHFDCKIVGRSYVGKYLFLHLKPFGSDEIHKVDLGSVTKKVTDVAKEGDAMVLETI